MDSACVERAPNFFQTSRYFSMACCLSRESLSHINFWIVIRKHVVRQDFTQVFVDNVATAGIGTNLLFIIVKCGDL